MALIFLVLVMLINVAVNFAGGPPYCWEFNDVSMDGWTGTGFTSSLSEAPYTYGIPSWIPPANYAYVQTTSTSKTGELTMPITIYDGDVISARLYRHVVQYDGTVRISLSFATEGVTKTLLTNPYYDTWEAESITCGVSYFDCCTYYPCDGELLIDGSVLTEDELVGVDYVAINSGCGYVPPPPPPPPPPYYECTFDSSVCGWSIATSSTGWHWSLYEGNPDTSKHPSFPVPSSPYIWVEDESTSVTSDVISGVTSSTVFYFDYYFDTTVPGSDYFEVTFYDINYHTSTALNPTVTYISGGWLYSQAFESPYVCVGASSCSGQIQINTMNTPYQKLLLAVDNFAVRF